MKIRPQSLEVRVSKLRTKNRPIFIIIRLLLLLFRELTLPSSVEMLPLFLDPVMHVIFVFVISIIFVGLCPVCV